MELTTKGRFANPDILLNNNPIIAQWDNWIDKKQIKDIMSKQVEQVAYTQGKTKTDQGHVVTERRQCLNHIIGDNDRLCLTQLEGQAAKFLGAPSNHFEPGVLLKYEPGGYFQAHHDFNSQVWEGQRSNRIASLLLYLNDDYEGGTTSFPDLGVTTQPRRGRAVFWRYNYSGTVTNHLFRHSGDPVISGIKYAVCLFLRDQPFVGKQRQRMSY